MLLPITIYKLGPQGSTLALLHGVSLLVEAGFTKAMKTGCCKRNSRAFESGTLGLGPALPLLGAMAVLSTHEVVSGCKGIKIYL